MKHVNRTITILVFIFLYIPMIVLAVASFNTGTDIASFKGFTLRQYANEKQNNGIQVYRHLYAVVIIGDPPALYGKYGTGGLALLG